MPTFVTSDLRRTLEMGLSFWIVVNNCVTQHGALITLKLLKHVSQTLCSKKKGGVDGVHR